MKTMSDFWNEQNIWVHIQNPQTINTTINKVKYDSPTVQAGVEVNFFLPLDQRVTQSE